MTARHPAHGRGGGKTRPGARAVAQHPQLHRQLALLAIWVLVLLPPLVFVPTAVDPFRLPKLLLCSTLALASLLALAFELRGREERTTLPQLASLPALAAALPLLLVATASLLWTAHGPVTLRALAPLAVAVAALVGWSAGLTAEELWRPLRATIAPAALLAMLAMLQVTGLYRPFGLVGGAEAARIGVVSLAGNAGDLGAFLVLPALLAQSELRRARGGARWAWAIVLAVVGGGLLASQTLTALGALLLGSAILWFGELPARRRLPVLGGALALAVLLIVGFAPLRGRVAEKAGALLRGDWNAVLTYRLDGWAAAAWMFRQHPLGGVGHGAYRAEFADARLALLDQGRSFASSGASLAFANAHNDLLEVAAELGLLGLAALGWGLLGVGRSARALGGHRRPLVLAGLVAAALLALAGFPFETALVAYPWLLFLAWQFAAAAVRGESAA